METIQIMAFFEMANSPIKTPNGFLESPVQGILLAEYALLPYPHRGVHGNDERKGMIAAVISSLHL